MASFDMEGDEAVESESVQDICAYCIARNKHQPAVNFCHDCGQYGRYICGSCLQHHAGHSVSPVTDAENNTRYSSRTYLANPGDEHSAVRIAERFSDLYDKEWVHVFDVFSNKRIDERNIISTLLFIVEEAYKFCQREAEEQLKTINSAVVNILEYGKLHIWDTNPVKTDTRFLKEFRKSYGTLSVQRLQERFFKERFTEFYMYMNQKKVKEIPEFNKHGAMEKYAYRAVEIAWWMNVQDPPVYMVPTTMKDFDPRLYRAYTKTGRKPDFFVWPALKDKRDGDVLSNGVVQYK